MPRADGPFEVLERINNNAYKINLPKEYGVSTSFNVADLSPYLEDDTLENLRANFTQQGEDDGDQAPNDQVNVPTVQPSQEKESKAQELAQIIKNIMTAQSTQIPTQLPDFVSLISQAWMGLKKLQIHFLELLICQL